MKELASEAQSSGVSEEDTRHPRRLPELIRRARGMGFWAPPIAFAPGEWWKGLARLEMRPMMIVEDRKGRL